MEKLVYLPFEKPIAELEEKISQLRAIESPSLDISNELAELSKKSQQLICDIYSTLTPWQITRVARHPQRPYTLDYINGIFSDFVELHGDRQFADDHAMVCGLAKLEGTPCVVIGQQKGRDLKDRSFRNFGMPKPEGYRKALRIMLMAEKFSLPIFTFVDTPGAFPGVDAEERGQSEAIGRNIYTMVGLRTPIVSVIIGEGGSGGALAIAVADRLLMLQYSTYSVISPEGCAAILWKTADRAEDAAAALGISASTLKRLGLIDDVIAEPAGAAHRVPDVAIQNVKAALLKHYQALKTKSSDVILQERHAKLTAVGAYQEPQKGLINTQTGALNAH